MQVKYSLKKSDMEKWELFSDKEKKDFKRELSRRIYEYGWESVYEPLFLGYNNSQSLKKNK